MDVPRKERPKQWKFISTGSVVLMNGVCYLCEGGMVSKTQAVCSVVLSHKMLSYTLHTHICLRCLDKKMNIGEEEIDCVRKTVQMEKNKRDLSKLSNLLDKMPLVVKAHDDIRVVKEKLDQGESIAPDRVKEVMTLLLIYENDPDLRDSYVWLKSNPEPDLMDVFAGRWGEWPTAQQRDSVRKKRKILSTQ
jgi:hypothetical protein